MTVPMYVALVLVLRSVLPCLSIDLGNGECCGMADDGYKIAPWNALMIRTKDNVTALGIGVLVDPSHVFVLDYNDDFDNDSEKRWHVLLNTTGLDDDKAIQVGVAGMEKFPCSFVDYGADHWVLTLEEEVLDVPTVCIESSSVGKLFEPAELTITYWKNSKQLAKAIPTNFHESLGSPNLDLPATEGNEVTKGLPVTILENEQSKLIGFIRAKWVNSWKMVRVHPILLKWIKEREFDGADSAFDCSGN